MSQQPNFRTLMVLGRISNLPTVWTNCLCGWLLGGGGSERVLLLLLLGGSLVYMGGMYLNDAFDAVFDRQYRRERPIPSRQISESLVWQMGGTLMALGGLLLGSLGWDTALFSALLLTAVLVYDAIHKAVAFSPLIMAACRFFLFLVAASAGDFGVTGLAVWTAVALSGWIVGLSYVARRESAQGPMRWWPLVALALPLVLGTLINDGEFRPRFWVCGGLLLIWLLVCLRPCFGEGRKNLGRTVSGLLAGICLVDLIALPRDFAAMGLCLAGFSLALLAQRFIPAT